MNLPNNTGFFCTGFSFVNDNKSIKAALPQKIHSKQL